jgi:cell division protein ZapA (FtsZ GTPase activity inhibitor)
MPPRKDTTKDKDNNTTRITDYISEDQPPVWARKLEEKLEQMEERLVGRFQNLQEVINMQDHRIANIETKTAKRCQDLEERMTDAEFHQRKYNLLFFGLKTTPTECEKQVKEFMTSDLEIADAESMLFQHCHPLPPGTTVIVRFVQFKDRERVLRSLAKLKGKNKKVTVRTDLPKDMREKRRNLHQQMQELKKDTNKIMRVAERGQTIRLEEKKNGKWEPYKSD